MLVGGGFFFMRAFPTLQIPNFKTPPPTHQSYFFFQSDLLAKLLWQNETALSIGSTVLRARMELTKKYATVVR
jgi:hypothetical protein